MKKTRLITLNLIALMFVMVLQVSAQPGRGDRPGGNNFLMYLDLDENQEAQASTFFTEMQKKVNPLRLDIDGKELELKKLMISDNADEKAINAKIDEIGKLKAEMRKVRIKNSLQLRSILTDEQKVLFDSREIERKRGGQPKMGKQCRLDKPNKMK